MTKLFNKYPWLPLALFCGFLSVPLLPKKPDWVMNIRTPLFSIVLLIGLFSKPDRHH